MDRTEPVPPQEPEITFGPEWTGRSRSLQGAGPSRHAPWLAPFLLVVAATLQAAPPYDIAPWASARLVDVDAGVGPVEGRRGEDRSGAPVDLAAGLVLESGRPLVLQWREPRSVREVVVRLRGGDPLEAGVEIAWWRRIWPDGGGGGWMKLDDPFNGSWTVAKVRTEREGNALRLAFAPLDAEEAPGIKRAGPGGPEHRHTYKVRISASRRVDVEGVEVYTGAVRREARIRVELLEGCGGRLPGHIEARNARVLDVVDAGPRTSVVRVEYADARERTSADRGVVTFLGPAPEAEAVPGSDAALPSAFSVFVDDVLREGAMRVRTSGAVYLVGDAGRGVAPPPGDSEHGKSPPDATAVPPDATGIWPEGTVRQRVARLPEQSFEEVRKAIPEKPRTHIFLGVPDLRQEIALTPEGHIQLLAASLRGPGPDRDRRPWTWDDLVLRIETEAVGEKRTGVERSLEEGWLPVVRHAWKAGPIEVVETSVAVPLLGDIAASRGATRARPAGGPGRPPGTDPIVLATRIELRNPGPRTVPASFRLLWSHPLPLRFGPDGLMLLDAPSDGIAREGLAPVRGRLEVRGKGAAVHIGAPPGGEEGRSGVQYDIDLGPGEGHAVELSVPYIELLDAEEVAALRCLSFEGAHRSAVAFWKERTSRGMTYEVPDIYLNELFKASLWHVLISTDLDPDTGRSQHGAATYRYKNYLNETAMVAETLEMRGEHEEALRLLVPFLDSQGTKGLPGNFRSKEGVLYAAHPTDPDPYTAQGYNMHHGWGLMQLARHWSYTMDTAFVRRIAGNLVEGCDWVARERRATMFLEPDGGRPVEYGLLPAGDLEDVEEYLYYYATNAYTYAGMRDAARALRAIGHPEAERLAASAEEYLRDIRRSVSASVARTPVVMLRDGSWIPYVPSRAYQSTHLSEGWIREALYSALHLVHCGIYPAEGDLAGWLADDLEDNIYLSAESGYGIRDPRESFFHLGGFTLQPNLVDLPVVYLLRDEVSAFLRGFYNAGWASLYPDAVCFAEWIPGFGRGGGPLYKTPDECKFVQWMRLMLILERETDAARRREDGGRDAAEGGRILELGLGVPRAWMTQGKAVRVRRAATLLGALDLEIVSRAAEDAVDARVRLRRTEAPAAVRIRLRHPEGKPIRSAEVNGKAAMVDGARQLVDLPAEEPATESSWDVTARF